MEDVNESGMTVFLHGLRQPMFRVPSSTALPSTPPALSGTRRAARKEPAGFTTPPTSESPSTVGGLPFHAAPNLAQPHPTQSDLVLTIH